MAMGKFMRNRRTLHSRPSEAPSRVAIEGLEIRTLLSTYTVTNVNDSGAGSLRQAILDSNKHSGADTIRFAIGSGARTITPRSALPGVMDTTTVDATTQAGYSGKPLIELNGTNVTSGPGLIVYGANSTIRGFVINRFGGNGIMLMGRTGYASGGITVEKNYVGTNAAGTAGSANKAHGINVVGGTVAGARNVISGNTKSGVALFKATATGNVVQGNYIGTDVTGSKDLGNTGRGVDFTTYAASNILGGTAAAARNVISGNDGGGVGVYNGSAFNLIQGNYIGVNTAGTGKLGNGGTGVSVSNSGPNTIGGATTGAGNVISANAQGIALAAGTGPMTIQGNKIGTNAAGNADFGNATDGIYVGSGSAVIGGSTAAAGNVISGNDGDGIRIYRAAGANIEHNWIGTDMTSSRDLGNDKCGVVIIGGSSNTIRSNTVCYSGAQGIYVMMGSGNTIAGNSLLGNAL